jgi:hypothetical protein
MRQHSAVHNYKHVKIRVFWDAAPCRLVVADVSEDDTTLETSVATNQCECLAPQV